MSTREASQQPALADLIELSRWQRLQDHFTTILGIALRTVSPARALLTTPSWPVGWEAGRAVEALHIGEELEPLIAVDQPLQGTHQLTTSLGTTYAAVPIHVTPTQLIAYFVVGPVMLGTREDPAAFRQRLRALGLDPEAIRPWLVSIKSYTFAGFRSVLTFLEEVGSALAQLAYQATHLPAILPERRLSGEPEGFRPGLPRVDQAVMRYYTQRVFQSLLDAAMTAARAEGGSILVYDPQVETFRIEAAYGLSDELVRSTRVKRGEGLAGLVAQEHRILLVDETIIEERITRRMQRPSLTSSLVAPLTVEAVAEPIGVLNLRTSHPTWRFTEEHVELLKKLLELAGVALGGLRLLLGRGPSVPAV